MSDAIKKFIEDRRTPWSEIQNIEIDGEFVKFTEKYDCSHPMCPIVRIEVNDNRLVSFSEIKKFSRCNFELMFGGIEKGK
jgi:hypothetical protein